MFLGIDVLRQAMAWGTRPFSNVLWAFLFAVTYAFLLRLPSEALPIIWAGQGEGHEFEGKAVCCLCAETPCDCA